MTGVASSFLTKADANGPGEPSIPTNPDIQTVHRRDSPAQASLPRSVTFPLSRSEIPMLLTQETSGSKSGRRGQENVADETNQSLMQPSSLFVIREVPVVLTGVDAVRSANQATLHYDTLRIEGLQTLLPEQIEIDVTPIAAGGQLRIDQIELPPCCEVIGVWFANPVVTIGPAN